MTSPLNNLPEKISAQTEEILFQKIRSGNKPAIHELVLGNLKEAVIYARHFASSFSDGELVSICYDVLLKSAPRFDTKYGIRFFPYTKCLIRGTLKRQCSKRDVVKHASERREDKTQSTFVPFTGGSEKTSGESEEVETCTQGGTVGFDFDDIHRKELWERVKVVIEKHLSPRQQMILTLTYKCGFNMQEAGELLGISRSAIQATHASALACLAGELREYRELFTGLR